MPRYPEALAHYKSHLLTYPTQRRQERRSAGAGFLHRVAGTTPLLPTRNGSEGERNANDAVHPHVHHSVHSLDNVRQW